MNKSEQIVAFIRKNNPRRKELVKFIVVNLNKKITSKEWDELPSTDSLHAYYATNITKWKYQGNVVVDTKTKRYSMTKYYNGKLYGMTTKVEMEMLEQRAKHWKNLFLKSKAENEILDLEKQGLQKKLNDIYDII